MNYVIILLYVCIDVVWLVICVIFVVDFFRYLSELIAERNKMLPFMPVLPQCYRLLNQGLFGIVMVINGFTIYLFLRVMESMVIGGVYDVCVCFCLLFWEF